MTGKILIEAHELINGQRQAEYGAAKAGFQRVAEMWGRTWVEK